MRTIIVVYEAYAARGTSIVPEEYRSIWTDEEGHVRDLSPPRVYDADDIHMWSCAWPPLDVPSHHGPTSTYGTD
jgi:hypothetical protein